MNNESKFGKWREAGLDMPYRPPSEMFEYGKDISKNIKSRDIGHLRKRLKKLYGMMDEIAAKHGASIFFELPNTIGEARDIATQIQFVLKNLIKNVQNEDGSKQYISELEDQLLPIEIFLLNKQQRKFN